MERKSFKDMECPIAQALEHVGEWWSILIIREAFYGAKRFDEFQQGLEGIAPNTLTRRLKSMVEKGLLQKVQYSQRPVRYEYILTECGRSFYPIMTMLLDWSNKYFAKDGIKIQLENIKTKKIAIPFIGDKNTGLEMNLEDYRIVAGPNASDKLCDKINSQVGLNKLTKSSKKNTEI
ncbi:winged helix-turn-helix transcriptional regulator [Aliarcobacter butzleri]|uniref:Helix-turn-helix domain-containing protein n=1 Tax=Aliarcobacter butzleri TaxID=28197 RepID=A0AAW7Q678_9BACT|nr:helix-turn-helix domain-containing protein [Aliarcobacter butzleri]MDN5114989.1 helix-turn-helix domain-containing protein [Aliarcobacter butzleri]